VKVGDTVRHHRWGTGKVVGRGVCRGVVLVAFAKLLPCKAMKETALEVVA